MKVPIYAIAICMFAVSIAAAQTTTAAFQGTVADTTGAVLPSAEVMVANLETGLRRTTISNELGRFVLSELPPGSYEITVSLPGFETLVRKGVTLAVGQLATLTLQLKVGGVGGQVTVRGERPMV